ncbi:molybdenum cofactor biosynthesis protein MoaE [Gammaproteobacteria bacterium]|nr:molybdenum cofactor biosynthesis protein MoaE [Gammaproteobacteria bacterium]
MKSHSFRRLPEVEVREIAVREEAFDSFVEAAGFRQRLNAVLGASVGASALFIGSMRDFNEDRRVSEMWLEHYPGMTEGVLSDMADSLIAEYQLGGLLIVHRVGRIALGDDIVLIVAASAHRREALSACQRAIETLKSSAPFWKKEVTKQGERWVDHNTPGA